MQYFPKNLFCTIRNLIEMLSRLIPSQSTRVGILAHCPCCCSTKPDLGVLGQRPNLAGPAQSDHGVESADDDVIHFS